MSDYGPEFCDVRDPEARKKHKPVSCPDKILTAFCQLGALRLRARRCLMFFFDVNHAYIMAEATRTLSLEDDAIHEPGDEVWMGHSVIPRDVACCETTVNLPSFPISNAAHGDIKKSVFVVNDLTKHPDLSTRPYVTGYPNGRFYAGVPITTPSGVNIGAYCILDDKVRDGVSEEELIFLRDMSQTVMTHLETVRALFERQQTNRMVAGLEEYVRGAADAGNKAPPATNMPLGKGGVASQRVRRVEYRLPDSLVDPTKTPTTASPELAKKDVTSQHHADSSAGHSQVPESSTAPVQQSRDYSDASSINNQKEGPLTRQAQTTTGSASKRTASPVKDSISIPPPRQQEDAKSSKSTYQRAAKILCQSLDIDGVAFLDASVQIFGGLSETQNAESTEGSADSDGSAGESTLPDSAADSQLENTKVCEVLGCAQTSPSAMEKNHSKDQPLVKLTESFLRGLMRRNPHGKVWTFDADFNTHTGDGFSSDDYGVDAARGLSSSTRRHTAARKDRRSDAQTLQAAFPGSRCVALHGIWDYTRRRWAVAGLYWTLDPLRHIAKDTEMRFVSAFCNIIVAETKRLEVVETDKAKSDFISNISHELRSPLHGILGSCELISDHGLDDTATIFLEQIESCGRTLLETIDHLLDFANLKSQRLAKGAVRGSRIGRKSLSQIGDLPAGGLKALDTSIALDDLTEDAVLSSVHSFYYDQSAENCTHIPVILDIDRSGGENWNCSLATGGWKRVCIHLVTNALKYTPSGFIRVTLKQEFKPGSRRRFNAILTVSDSGKGMSKKFQRDHLFNDFAQEDTLSHGLGLGMHMVSRIVYAMGGSIAVVSDQEGSGTCVTVRVPLEHDRVKRNHGDTQDKSRDTTPKAFEGLKFGLITGAHASADSGKSSKAAASAMAIASVENNLKFLSVQSERCKWQHIDSYDLVIILEAELAECLAALRKSTAADDDGSKRRDSLPPLLVLCDNIPSAQILRKSRATDHPQSGVVIEFVALPCGIKQITQAISSALSLHKKYAKTVSNTSEAHQEAGVGSFADGSAPHDTATHNELQLRSLASQTARNETSNRGWVEAGAECSPTEVQMTVVSSHRTSAPRTDLEVLSAWLSVPEIPSIEGSVTSAILTITKKPILLLVDDNMINLKLLATFAKKYNYPHLLAHDGQLAVDAFENAHRNLGLQKSPKEPTTSTVGIGIPNVILMDINMPVMDGYEAVQRIRSYERKNHIKASRIIAVTALQSEAAQAEAFGSGFDMFLSKPLKLKALARLIEAC
jgi:signal transduction histidine kinase/CheY-like chemotaxis protein/GAF domain-containing protein